MAEEERGVALVTGAARRIGLAIADRLAREGFSVALHASVASHPEAERQADRLRSRGARTCALSGDLADPAVPRRLVAEAERALGPVTLLVNSASLFEPDTARDPGLLDRHLAVNLRAPLLLAAELVERLPAGREGTIVNIVDQRVLKPNPVFFSYGLSKSALWNATCTMAQAFAPRRVRVNAVGPGPTFPNRFDGEEGMREEVGGLPLGRAVQPEEIADAVLFLARSRSVTGQLIAVDAGQHLGWITPDVPLAYRNQEPSP
ncbi:MAG: short chain dehydrogenase [Enterovirga sp.]|nr:short chain dehydrogenase [Enterovirga sp.]